MLKKFSLLSLAVLSVGTASAAITSSWQDFSNPANVSPNFNYKMSALPQEAMLPQNGKNWSDDFWPTKKGSINRRWNSPSQQGFKLNSPSKDLAKNMSARQLEELAPSEKFDLYLGRYDYPTVKIVGSTASENAKDWAGICNGWSPASSLLVEPKPITLKNPDGISVPFGSSDIKGLLSYYYAFYGGDEPTRQMGLKCFLTGGFRVLARGCNDDLNAGAFHVIMSNRLGIEKKGFLMDRDRLNEIWNQPVVGYQSNVTKKEKNKLTVETNLYFTEEINPNWDSVTGTPNQKTSVLELEYELELDSYGNIVGGSWTSWNRPDFLWFKDKAIEFTGNFAELKTVYEASLK